MRELKTLSASVRTQNQKCSGNHTTSKGSARIKDNFVSSLMKQLHQSKTRCLSETCDFAPIKSALLGKNQALCAKPNRVVIIGKGISSCSGHLLRFSIIQVNTQLCNSPQITESYFISVLFKMPVQITQNNLDHCATTNYYFGSFE